MLLIIYPFILYAKESCLEDKSLSFTSQELKNILCKKSLNIVTWPNEDKWKFINCSTVACWIKILHLIIILLIPLNYNNFI